MRFVKRLRFEPESYRLHLELALENQALDAGRSVGFVFTPAEVVPAEAHDKYYVEPQAIAAGRGAPEGAQPDHEPAVADLIARSDDARETTGGFDIPSARISFAGVHNKYFAVLMRAADAAAQTSLRNTRWRRVRDEAWARANPAQADRAWHYVTTDVVLQLDLPPRGETRRYAYVLYAGPKDRVELEREHADFNVLPDADLGTFLGVDMSGVGLVMLAVLGFFERLTGNWGIAIILLTLAVRAVLFPLNRRSQTSMARYAKKMKRVQPQLDELKKRYEKELPTSAQGAVR